MRKTMNLFRSALAGLALCLLPSAALADSGCRYIRTGAVLTAGQWNECFASKQDALGYTPLNITGGTMLGPFIAAASATTAAGFRLQPGVAPTSPVNGDMWSTSVGMYIRINGVTIGPLASTSSGSFSATSPMVVTFPSGVVTYAFDFSVANTWVGVQTFTNSTIKLLGSSTGATTFTSANASATNYTATFPANTGTVAQLNFAQTWSAVQSFADSNVLLSGSSSGSLVLRAAAAAGTGVIRFPAGSTDFSATGGTSQVVKQVSSGAALTVGQLACADLSNASSGCSSAAGVTALTGDVTASGSGSVAATLATAQPAVHTWALAQTFTVAPVFTDASGSRTALGLGTAATQATGTSGATLPFLNGNNTYSGTSLFTGGTPSLSNGNAAVAASTTLGGIFTGKGSSKDVTIANGAGSTVCDVATGTTTINCATLTTTNRITSASIDLATNATIGVMRGDTTTISCVAGVCSAVGAVSASIGVGTTTIAAGTTTRILYDNAGTLGEYTISGTGTAVAMQTSPALVTPSIGVATGTSLGLGGCTISATVPFCITGSTAPFTMQMVGTNGDHSGPLIVLLNRDTGNPNGAGPAIYFDSPNSVGTNFSAAIINAGLITATAGAEQGSFEINLQTASPAPSGVRVVFAINADNGAPAVFPGSDGDIWDLGLLTGVGGATISSRFRNVNAVAGNFGTTDAYGLNLKSNGADKFTGISFGRTAVEGQMMMIGATSQFLTGSAVGDLTISNTGNVLIGSNSIIGIKVAATTAAVTMPTAVTVNGLFTQTAQVMESSFAGTVIWDLGGSGGNLSIQTGGVSRFTIANAGTVNVVGTFTAGTKTFLIDHPLDPNNKDLSHANIEAPRYDVVYRGKSACGTTVSIDAASNMTDGTFDALTQNAEVVSLNNLSGFDRAKSSPVKNGRFTILCEKAKSTDVIHWVVIAERADAFIKNGTDTHVDKNGRMVPEQAKAEPKAGNDNLGARGFPRHWKELGMAKIGDAR